MFLIVGLGNPGEKYDHTRHNVGFDVLTLLSEKLHIPIDRARHRALVGEGTFAGEKVVLCKPQTYMNLSGEAVQALLSWYKLPPEQLMVIYDDIDLAPGWLRIRRDGSAGTHNGMRSIVCCIGTEAFPRIRVGIGGRPPQFELADWVLSHYHTPEERQASFDAYTHAADAAVEWMRNGIQSAMTRYNTQKPKPPKPERPEKIRPSDKRNATVAEGAAGVTHGEPMAGSAAATCLAGIADSITAADEANLSAPSVMGGGLHTAGTTAFPQRHSALSDGADPAASAPQASDTAGAPLSHDLSRPRKTGSCAADPTPANPQESSDE